MTDNYWVEGQVYVATGTIELPEGKYLPEGSEFSLETIQSDGHYIFNYNGFVNCLIVENGDKNYLQHLYERSEKKKPFVGVDCGTLFYELSKKEVQELFDAYLSSKIIQEKNPNSEFPQWFDMDFNDRLCFDMNCYYRIKPEIR